MRRGLVVILSLVVVGAAAAATVNRPPAEPTFAQAACTSTPAFGETIACSIDAPNETDSFTLSGSAGDKIRVTVVETSVGLLARWQMFRPDNSSLCGPFTLAEFTCTLDTGGVHRLDVRDNSGSGTGGYNLNLQRLNGPAGCGPISFGNPSLSGTIAVAAEVDCYTFAGTSGDRLRLTAVETSGMLAARHEVLRPDGTVLCGPIVLDDEQTCLLDTTGTHAIFLKDNGGSFTGGYNLHLQRLSNPAGCAVATFGNPPLSGTIGAAAQTNCYTFSGASGERVRATVVETSGTLLARQEIVRPDGTTLCGHSTSQEQTCLLNATGTHTLLVRDNSGQSTGGYSLHLQRLSNPAGCNAASFGNPPLAGSIDAAAETDCFTFSGNSGDRVRVTVVKTSGTLAARQELLRPDGATLCGPVAQQEQTCLLNATGTHAILIRDSGGAGTGGYSLHLQRVSNPAGCTAVNLGNPPLSASVSEIAETDCYTFAGTAGDRMRVTLVETSGGLVARQEVLRPDGVPICTPSTSQEVTCLLDTTGTHVILVRDNSGVATGGYSLHLQRLSNPVGCSTVTFGNPPLAAAISEIAETDCYTFGGAAGDQVRVTVVETSGASTARQEVLRPDGATLCGPTSLNQEQTCILDVSGTHTVLIRDSAGTAVGGYSLHLQRLNNPVGCSAISFGNPPQSDSVAVAAETDCYTFAGATGDRIRLRTVETSGSLIARHEVLRPDGAVLCGPTTLQEQTCLLDATGTHAILVRDSGGAVTGAYSAYLQRLSNPIGCTAVAIGNPPVSGLIGLPAEADCYTFAGTSGQNIRVRVTETAGGSTPVQEVLRPDGATRCGPTSSTQFDCLLDTTGTHSILVKDSTGQRAGAYCLHIQSPPGTAPVFDADSDRACDDVDPCLANPDCDGDGFKDGIELYDGTDPLDNCRDDTFDNAWPADIDNDGFSDISDIIFLTGVFGSAAPPAPLRYDIADPPDGFTDISDVSRMLAFFGQGCA